MNISFPDQSSSDTNLELRWVGSSGPCTDLSLNNQSVLAGTWLKVKMQQLGAISGYRPDSVFIFQRPEKRIAAAIKRLGRMHGAIPLDHLILKEDSEGNWESDDWPLKAPLDVKGRLEVFCSIDDEGRHRGPSVTSVAYKQQTIRTLDKGKNVRGGLDFAGLGSELEINSQSEGVIEFTATAAVDPSVSVDVLVPGDGSFEHYLDDYLRATAGDVGVAFESLRNEFYSQNSPFLSEYAAKNLDFDVQPRFFDIDADERRAVKVSVRSWGAPQPALVVIRMTDLESRVQTVSDLILVSDGDTLKASAVAESIRLDG